VRRPGAFAARGAHLPRIPPLGTHTRVMRVCACAVSNPLRSWDFLGWFLAPARLSFFEKAAVAAVALRLLGIFVALATGRRRSVESDSCLVL
jgi:hypothetical protein